MMAIEWKIGYRKWNAEKNYLPKKTVINHPLEGVQKRQLESTSVKQKKLQSQTVVDPLSSMFDGPDPLSDLLTKTRSGSSNSLGGISEISKSKSEENKDIRFICWDDRRTTILNEFTTSTPLTLVSSFLNISDSGVLKTQNSIPERSRNQGLSGSERVRARLEELDNLDEIRTTGSSANLKELGGLTQDQFSHRLMELKEELTVAWNSDQRVKSLNICIQCIKLLGMSTPEHFYPSKFILVTDVVDTLASLVEQRLNEKTNNPSPQSRNKSMHGNEAEETARNWFYKVSLIRDLLPRLYLEAALLPCFSLLNCDKEKTLMRLTNMIRGIGDPLVAAYARMYVVRTGNKISPNYVPYIVENIKDFIQNIKWGWSGEGIVKSGSNTPGDLDNVNIVTKIFVPPLEWMLQCLSSTASAKHLMDVLELCQKLNVVSQVIMISSILRTMPCNFLAQHSLCLTQYISAICATGGEHHNLIELVGAVVNESPPADSQKLALLNAAWKLIAQTPSTIQYLKSAVTWLQFTATHFTASEVDKLLGDVLKHLGSALTTEAQLYYPVLVSIVTTALTYAKQPQALFSMGSFQGLVSVFQRDSIGTLNAGVIKEVVEALLTHHKEDLSDPSVVQLLLSLCSALHDGLNALTTEDEKRQAGHLITSFIRQVNFGRDFENLLDFYVDARAAFSNLDMVLVNLVLCVCKLSIATNKVVKGQHTGKTAAFVRACSAYCFITIPSLKLATVRLKLYLVTAAVSSANHCLGQSDACIKAAIREVTEVTTIEKNGSNNSDLIESVIGSLSSLLVAAPDPPEADVPLYLFQGLVNAVVSFDGDEHLLMQLYLCLICALSTTAQDTLPYHMSEVEGNDALYGGDPIVKQEAERLCSPLINQLITYIKNSTGIKEKRCCSLTLKFFWCVVIWGDLESVEIMSLAASLWSLFRKQSTHNINLFNSAQEWLKLRATNLKDENLQKLAQACYVF